MPPKKLNHIHIPANPQRMVAEEISQRQKKRKENGKPREITNEILYELLMDIMEKQELLEQKLNQSNQSNLVR